MHILIISNLDNGSGLRRDYQVLRHHLERWGHSVEGVHFVRPYLGRRGDLAIFLEVVPPHHLALAPRRWLVPNVEWWTPQHDEHLASFELVLCRTRDALRRLSTLPARTHFTGFTSVDRWDGAVRRERRFLHVVGGSPMKGTEAVLAAWRRYRLPHPLTVVSSIHPAPRLPGVRHFGRVDDARLRALQNAHAFHLCPSRYEGWGHTQHEALSVGAAVVTTDAAPMNEFPGCSILVDVALAPQTQGLVSMADPRPESVRDAVERCAAYPDAELRRIRSYAREAFLDERERFVESLWRLVGPALPRAPSAPVRASRASRAAAPRVAVVVRTSASRAALARRAIRALRAQSLPPAQFEVVVACDGGDPAGLVARAVEPAAHPFHVQVAAVDRSPGASHPDPARDVGWRAARSPLCLLLDADCLLPVDALERLLAAHDAAVRRGIPTVFAPAQARIDLPPDVWLERSAPWALDGSDADYRTLWRGLPVKEEAPGTGDPGAVGARPARPVEAAEMCFVWRGLLDSVGRYDERGPALGAFADVLDGLRRARLLDARPLHDVRVLRQPCALEPETPYREARARRRARAQRQAEIHDGALWWREQLDRARVDLAPAVASALPASDARLAAALSWEAIAARVDAVEATVTEAALRVRGLLGPVVVVGEARELIAMRIAEVCGLTALPADVAQLAAMPSHSACAVVLGAPTPGVDEAELGRQARRVVGVAGPVVAGRRGLLIQH